MSTSLCRALQTRVCDFLWQGLRATEIDVVVTNMCTFAPTPSLSALLVHRFGMRADTLTYSLVRTRSSRA